MIHLYESVWDRKTDCVEFSGRSNLLVVANWPHGGGNCHCNVGSPGQQNVSIMVLADQFPIYWLLNMGLGRTSVNKLQVTCLLNIFEHPLTLFCYICFAVLLSVICCIRSLPGLKKKHSVLFCSLQGGRSRSVPWVGAESQLV